MLQADKLSGEWKLVYTSGSELSALLALSRLPFVTVGDITQTIDGAAGTVVNKVHMASRPAPGAYAPLTDLTDGFLSHQQAGARVTGHRNKHPPIVTVDVLGLQVTLMDAVTRTAFSSTANFEVRSSKLLNVRVSCCCQYPC